MKVQSQMLVQYSITGYEIVNIVQRFIRSQAVLYTL